MTDAIKNNSQEETKTITATSDKNNQLLDSFRLNE